MTSWGTFTVGAYCLCGATMQGSGAGDLDTAGELENIFWTKHRGEGHGVTDSKGAAAGRRKAARRTR